jgi:hypothetical protein
MPKQRKPPERQFYTIEELDKLRGRGTADSVIEREARRQHLYGNEPEKFKQPGDVRLRKPSK